MIFESVETIKVISYIKEKYGDEPQFLWAKTPQNAVFRHKDSLKWYGAILNVAKQKLGISQIGNTDILDLKCDPLLIGSLRDGKTYFPAYHMNKEHWITILLDDNVQLDKVFSLIDLSYKITCKHFLHF